MGGGAALRDTGVTIILTTHYIEEAEEMADRVGVINKGELMLVEEKAELMRKLGKKQLTLQLQKPLDAIPERLRRIALALADDGSELIYTYDTQRRAHRHHRAASATSSEAGIRFRDLQTTQSSLEEIFVSLVSDAVMNFHAVKAIYKFEMARTLRTLLQSIVSPVDLDLALFRRLRRGDRLAHQRDRRRQLRRLHRARPDHAVAAHAEHLQRLLRHLFPEIHRHDLRAAVGAGVLRRDRARPMSARPRPSRSCSA